MTPPRNDGEPVRCTQRGGAPADRFQRSIRLYGHPLNPTRACAFFGDQWPHWRSGREPMNDIAKGGADAAPRKRPNDDLFGKLCGLHTAMNRATRSIARTALAAF